MANDAYKADREMLEALLDITSSRVQQNCEVVTPDTLKETICNGKHDVDFQLHISTNTNIRKFVPQLTLRGSPQENRDITRVCVSPTLLGCMIGYAKVGWDVLNQASTGKEEHDGYKGGWKIYALPMKACLRPNVKMVWDQKMSDEHWMVSYSEETKEFIPESAGRFFVESITMVTRARKTIAGWMTMYVEVTREGGIPLTRDKWLDKGYYKLGGPDPQLVKDWKEDAFEITAIKKDEYMSAKRVSADLLAHVDNPPPKPAFMSWTK